MKTSEKLVLAVAWGASVAGALFAGYTIAEKKLQKEYDERLERELDASVTFLEERGKAEPTEEYKERRTAATVNIKKPSLDEVVAERQRTAYHTIVSSEGYSPETPQEDDPDDKVIVQREDEVEVIGRDEFLDNESGYDQDSITYYADGAVLDDHGELVVDFESLIGPGVPPFGQSSGESHVVYLRNKRLKREFEVIRDEDTNAADILADPSDVT